MKHSILCVDDELDNVDALERIFRRKYRVLKALSGAEGLEILRAEPSVALIISDQRMPKMTGVEFLKKSIKIQPDTIRILLTGYTDMDSVVGAINSGEVYRYLTKPWDSVDLSNTIDKAIEKFELRQELIKKNQALEKALVELQTLDQAKTQFMMLINHELKTPLTVILSFLELLGESNLNEEQQLFHKRIDQSTQRLQSIIDEVLELVSAETGQLKLSRDKIDLENIFTSVRNKWNDRTTEKSLSWKSQFNNPKVNADKNVLENILNRLTDNATKFAPDGSTIEFLAKKDPDNDELIVVTIRNQGKALTKKAIEKILKPFTLDEEMLNHSKGLGMGLSISQALLKTHQSQLEINSSGGWVETSFRLPAV